MPTTNHDELLSDGLEKVSDAARFLKVSRSAIYKLMESGILPSVWIGRSRRIPVRAVRKLASDQLAASSLDEE